MSRTWTKASAMNYIKNAKKNGLKLCSAMDFIKNHTKEETPTITEIEKENSEEEIE